MTAELAAIVTSCADDPLTGLANRALLEDRLGQALTRDARHLDGVAVLVLDLDDFKTVNDRWGHAAGDALLMELAARLQAILRPEDTVARLGGDEFAIVIEGATTDQAAEVAGRIVAELSSPVVIEHRPVEIQASVGLAHSGRPDTDPQGVTPATLLRHADVAMYVAKAAGKAAWRAYHPAMRDTADRLSP